jgi:polar amino acid transport system permease protein
MISNVTFRPFVVFSCVALLYFALCFPISLFARHLERRTHVQR